MLFVPCDFATPVEMRSPFEWMVGSAPRALRQLKERSFAADAMAARQTLAEALTSSSKLRLPVVVDL